MTSPLRCSVHIPTSPPRLCRPATYHQCGSMHIDPHRFRIREHRPWELRQLDLSKQEASHLLRVYLQHGQHSRPQWSVGIRAMDAARSCLQQGRDPKQKERLLFQNQPSAAREANATVISCVPHPAEEESKIPAYVYRSQNVNVMKYAVRPKTERAVAVRRIQFAGAPSA